MCVQRTQPSYSIWHPRRRTRKLANSVFRTRNPFFVFVVRTPQWIKQQLGRLSKASLLHVAMRWARRGRKRGEYNHRHLLLRRRFLCSQMQIAAGRSASSYIEVIFISLSLFQRWEFLQLVRMVDKSAHTLIILWAWGLPIQNGLKWLKFNNQCTS